MTSKFIMKYRFNQRFSLTIIAFLLSLAGFSHTTFAQDASYYFKPVPEPKDYGTILFSFGPTKAVGDFASTDYMRQESGFVEMGFSGTISYLSPTIGGIGFIVRGVAAVSPVDNGMLRVALEDQLLGSQTPITSISNAGMDAWTHIGGLGGLNLSLPSDRLTLEIRGLAGYMSHMRPDMSFDFTVASTGTNSATYTRLGESVSAFAWQAEAGFRYDFRKGAALGVSLGYLSSSPEMTVNQSISPSLSVEAPQPMGGAFKQNISLLYLNFGIGVNLGNGR